MDKERMEFIKAFEGFTGATNRLVNAWYDLNKDDREALHVDCTHSHCSDGTQFADMYRELFSESFDEWAYRLGFLNSYVCEKHRVYNGYEGETGETVVRLAGIVGKGIIG